MAWVEDSVSPHIPGYGYQWWLRDLNGVFADVQDVYRQYVPEWCKLEENAKPSRPNSAPEPGLGRFHESTFVTNLDWTVADIVDDRMVALRTTTGPDSRDFRFFAEF
jgi:hypothetical protein